MGVFSSSAPQTEEPQGALGEPTENENMDPETGESQVRGRVARDSQPGEEGGAGAALNVHQVRGEVLDSPGDQWVVVL